MADYRVVRLSPHFFEPSDMQRYIESKGFHDYTRFVIFDDYAMITFDTEEIARTFVEHFDGTVINDRSISASIPGTGRNSPYESPEPPRRPRPPRIASHTVSITGYPSHSLTDRRLWHDFSKLGFIREIECQNNVGYIEYDTEDDAYNAMKEMDEATVEHVSIQVTMIPDRVLNKPDIYIPLARVDKDDRHVPIRQRDPPRQREPVMRPRDPRGDFRKRPPRDVPPPRDFHKPGLRAYELDDQFM
jgi:RNA recognition motif-containing protein